MGRGPRNDQALKDARSLLFGPRSAELDRGRLNGVISVSDWVNQAHSVHQALEEAEIVDNANLDQHFEVIADDLQKAVEAGERDLEASGEMIYSISVSNDHGHMIIAPCRFSDDAGLRGVVVEFVADGEHLNQSSGTYFSSIGTGSLVVSGKPKKVADGCRGSVRIVEDLHALQFYLAGPLTRAGIDYIDTEVDGRSIIDRYDPGYVPGRIWGKDTKFETPPVDANLGHWHNDPEKRKLIASSLTQDALIDGKISLVDVERLNKLAQSSDEDILTLFVNDPVGRAVIANSRSVPVRIYL